MTERDAAAFQLKRRDVVKSLLAERDSLLVVAGLGSAARDITAAGDTDLNFPLWGAMGGAVALGLGLALAQPARRVLVLTGDGEMLMGLGSLATVAVQQPRNLAIGVLDNERYGETGMQATHTAFVTDLVAVAVGCGIADAAYIETPDDLERERPALLDMAGPVFRVIKVRAEKLDFVLPPKDGVHLKNRFRRAVLGAEAVA